MRRIPSIEVAAYLLPILCTLSHPAHSGPYREQGPFVMPLAGNVIPGPKEVPGKEFSNRLDRQAHPNQATANPGQVVAWDGAGGTGNSTDLLAPGVSGEVDALANHRDNLFMEVGRNRAALLLSVGTRGMDTRLDDHILFESVVGKVGSWARPFRPAEIDQTPPDDIDGLELWGPIVQDSVPELENRQNSPGIRGGRDGPGFDDANRYSKEGGGGAQVFNSAAGVIYNAAQLQNAIQPLYPTSPIDQNLVDVDGLMMFSPEIIFSLQPISTILDGGEIFVWSGTPGERASFLNHGGHLWNTDFNVRQTFNSGSENVDALEAVSTVPESSTLLMFVTGLAGLLGYSWRRKQTRVRFKSTEFSGLLTEAGSNKPL